MVENNQSNQVEMIEDVVTRKDIKRQLEAMGIQKGMLLLVQGNALDLGYISGGSQAMIDAIMDCVGYEGTIVMPSFTLDLVDPACMSKNHIDKESWEDVRESSYPFNKKLSKPTDCDELVLQFMRNDGIVRSYHPNYSFLAWGKYAKVICDKHPLHFGLSKDSPLGKLYDLNAYVLLLGSEYKDCAIFNLAHYNSEKLPIRIVSAPIEKSKKTAWKDMLDLELNNEGFNVVGEVMEERKIVRTTYLGLGKCRLFSAREAVKIATAYLNIN
ncbi:MAG: AAC(3) family N-acetyltransferase [Erysipelotrichaceae bacterium]